MTPGPGDLVVGVDSGGSGLRVALARASADGLGPAETVVSRTPVRTGDAGIDAGHLLEQLLPMVRAARDRTGPDGPGGAGPVAALAVGAAGMGTLGGRLRAELPAALADALGVRRLALAADAVTAYAGALGQRPGTVVAAGTGMIATGTDLTAWRRADGWGHLLGDCGGGAWLGRKGLEAALRAHDGRRGGSPALLAAAERVFGPVAGLPGRLYPRSDRPAVLASFAPEVARRAAEGDTVAEGILGEAARHIADAAEAVCPGESAGGTDIALTGGLFGIGDLLLVPLRTELTARLPHARVVPPAGDPLSGALLIASALATDSLRLPADPTMLFLTGDGREPATGR
ncbi:BadF/BadG/BcrA/BcrD ATPase family protein [Streptomyces sp. NPDC006798]|uniref:N-acetylglucosamine kinase n=1 Tax=Streptomyces sp. NPDC006798 TaxID=3155462 RepID=UPI0033F9906C